MNVSTQAAGAKPRHRTHEYETIYVLRSDVDADTAEKVQARVADAIDREHGKLVKVEAWGRRKLAYTVGKQRKGLYIYVKYVGGGGLVAEVERNLKLQEAVMKFLTVQTREAVDVSALQIDPEEIKLGKLELPTEPEPEESREKQLGLVDLTPEGGDRRRGEDEYADEAEAAPTEEAQQPAKAEGTEEN